MPKHDPIITVGLVAALGLAGLAALIYFGVEDDGPAAAPPLPTTEQAKYQALQQSLQQTLQQAQALEQENRRLEQKIQTDTQANQALGKAMEKLRQPKQEQ